MRTALMLSLVLLSGACKGKDAGSGGDSKSSSKKQAGPTGTARPQSKLTVTLDGKPVPMATALAYKTWDGQTRISVSSVAVGCSEVTGEMRRMHDGEGPSMWSNWLAAEAVVMAFDTPVPSPELSVEHVVASQAATGGIGWGPTWAQAGQTELRAAGFAFRWMEVIGRLDDVLDVMDTERLIGWVLALGKIRLGLQTGLGPKSLDLAGRE